MGESFWGVRPQQQPKSQPLPRVEAPASSADPERQQLAQMNDASLHSLRSLFSLGRACTSFPLSSWAPRLERISLSLMPAQMRVRLEDCPKKCDLEQKCYTETSESVSGVHIENGRDDVASKSSLASDQHNQLDGSLTACSPCCRSRAAVASRASLAATEASQRAAAYSSSATAAASKAALHAERRAPGFLVFAKMQRLLRAAQTADCFSFGSPHGLVVPLELAEKSTRVIVGFEAPLGY